MSTKAVTRKQWAAKICAIHARTVQGVFQMGRELLAAKKNLPYGTFIAMVESDLPFGKRTAQRLMAIAADRRLAKAAQGSLLPAIWRTLYELHKLPDDALEQAITENPDRPLPFTTHKAAAAIVEPPTVVNPVYKDATRISRSSTMPTMTRLRLRRHRR